MRTSLVLFLYIRLTLGLYQVFKDNKSWKDTESYCQLNKGKLANIYSMTVLPENLRHSNLSFWVGGILNDKGFIWKTKQNEGKVIPLKPLTHHRGCYSPAFILGGHRMKSPSSEECFKTCNWTGQVGLKSIYCLCQDNLRNITRTADIQCDSKCIGNSEELCGGPKGVSMYNLNANSVLWGSNEPSSKYECVYVRKSPKTKNFRWFTSSCQMRMRYICRFEDHAACGVQKSCLRSSVQPETWEGSINRCRLLNGTAAVVDVTMMYDDDDTERLPPGEYWIGLKRLRRWEWRNGLPISSSLFHRRIMSTTDNNKCVILSSEGGFLGLSNAPCLQRKSFICQYDMKLNYDKTTKSLKRSNNTVSKELPVVHKVDLNKNSENISSKETGNSNEDDSNDYQKSLYKSIMYLAIGIASGMGLVFSICTIVYVGKRCNARKTDFKTVRYPKNIGQPVLRYVNDTQSNNAEPEVLYEIPCDAQESPFHATQRILHQNYAIHRDGFPSNSWRRRKSDRDRNGQQFNRQPEIRNIKPYNERSYGDTSYIIHNVHAQCHPNSNSQGQPVDITYTGSLDTRLRRPSRESDVRLSETYSFPEQGRKMSEPMFHVDTSDLYACVDKVMNNVDGDYFDNNDPTIHVTLC